MSMTLIQDALKCVLLQKAVFLALHWQMADPVASPENLQQTFSKFQLIYTKW